MNRRLIEYNPEGYGVDGEAPLFGGAPSLQTKAPSELNELELASAFLDASSPSAMTSLLRRIVRVAGVQGGHAVHSRVAMALLPRLERTASVIGRLLSTRKITALAGRPIQSAATVERVFGTELEGLSAEDQEFEAARSFVRFALEAARTAAIPPAKGCPNAIAAAAEKIAARRYAPGLSATRMTRQPGFRNRRALRRSFV